VPAHPTANPFVGTHRVPPGTIGRDRLPRLARTAPPLPAPGARHPARKASTSTIPVRKIMAIHAARIA
jgi:hypothetical protein